MKFLEHVINFYITPKFPFAFYILFAFFTHPPPAPGNYSSVCSVTID